MRLAVLQFVHETVTFLANDTTLADFTYPGSPAEGEALLASDPKGYMGGFVKVACEFDGVDLIGIEAPLWPRTGTGSGWVTQEVFEHFVGRMIEALRAGPKVHGVFLALHGAMAVRGVMRPEAEEAGRARRGRPEAASHGRSPSAPRGRVRKPQALRNSSIRGLSGRPNQAFAPLPRRPR